MSTFLVHKNQLPLFFLCAKYDPKVNTVSRGYDERVTQSFLFSAECTIGMVWGLTPLKHYGNKALWQ